jgi:hypothetical protein
MRMALAALRGNPASAAFYPRHHPRSKFAATKMPGDEPGFSAFVTARLRTHEF